MSDAAVGLFRGLGPRGQQRQLGTAARARRELYQWVRAGRPAPPPHVIKQMTLRAYARRFGLTVLVESGTFLGDMVAAMLGEFDRIYSIELGDELYERAVQRFRGRDDVELVHGDSATELGSLLSRLRQPALFWLDGHYSEGITARGPKDTPILDELDHILGDRERRHVVLVDDARVFGVDSAYPSIEELSRFVRERRPQADISIKDDSIRITEASDTRTGPPPAR